MKEGKNGGKNEGRKEGSGGLKQNKYNYESYHTSIMNHLIYFSFQHRSNFSCIILLTFSSQISRHNAKYIYITKREK